MIDLTTLAGVITLLVGLGALSGYLTNYLKKQVKGVLQELQTGNGMSIGSYVHNTSDKLKTLEEKVCRLDGKVDKIDSKVARLDHKVDRLERKLPG